MAWSDSFTEVVQMESGCRIAAPRLFAAKAINCDVLEGRTKRLLVKIGQQKACAQGRPFLLRLKTGRRGRPQERVILPPKPTHGKSSPSRPSGAVRKTAANNRSKLVPGDVPNSPDLAGALAAAERRIRELSETVGKLEHEIQVIGTLRTDIAEFDERIGRLEKMIESMRRTWREAHDYTPHHPELPLISSPILPIPAGASR